jgi:hypothetical protein
MSFRKRKTNPGRNIRERKNNKKHDEEGTKIKQT